MSDDKPLHRVLSKLKLVTRHGKNWAALCPAHDDTKQSLTLAEGDKHPVVLTCQAGCDRDTILSAIDMRWSDICAPNGQHGSSNGLGQIVATYDYADERGALAYQVVRFEPKTFRPRLASGVWGVPGETPRYLSRLAAIRKKAKTTTGTPTVFIVEGEKDADRLWDLKLPATTNVGGAGKGGPAQHRAAESRA